MGYLQGLLWRIRGLRVRSRNRLATLMGASPRAYSLWMARIEPRVKAALAPENDIHATWIVPLIAGEGTSAASNVTLRPASAGELPEILGGQEKWLCILEPGDRLAEDALRIYANAVAGSEDAWVVYADDDLLVDGRREAPHFKSSWNPELFEHHDYVTGSAIIRVAPDMLSDLPPTGWAKVLTERAVRRGRPMHLPVVLHHRAARPEPSVPQKPLRISEERLPPVSVIVPTRNALSLLRTSAEGVLRTPYHGAELIVIDNDSDDAETLAYLDALRHRGVAVIKVSGPFNFSALNNEAVRQARTPLLCFLNNDVEITDPDWLALLARQAIRPDIGAVGGRLLYPDGTVQHAGVVTSVGGGAAHAHRLQREDQRGYFLRDRLPQRVSAVTAACLVVEREKFLAVGGFNEVDFPVAFNDVDLCLKLNSRGWQSFYEPRATLIHHESKSRGSDRSKENRDRFAGELEALKRQWGTDRTRDPYHHPHLSPFSEQFYIAL